jgi:hypothetical protein
VFLILALIGAVPRWSHSLISYFPTGGVGLVLAVVVVLVLRLHLDVATPDLEVSDGRIQTCRQSGFLRRKSKRTWLCLSLSKKGIEEHVRWRQQSPDQSDVLQRTNEGSEKIVAELRKSN